MRKERRHLLVNRGTADQIRTGIGGLGITQLYPIELQPHKIWLCFSSRQNDGKDKMVRLKVIETLSQTQKVRVLSVELQPHRSAALLTSSRKRQRRFVIKSSQKLQVVRPKRLELLLSRFVAEYFFQLSYERKFIALSVQFNAIPNV